MSKPRFDSSQMLPLFQIISPNASSTNVLDETTIVPSSGNIQKHKKKHKRPDVPVHKSHNIELNPPENISIHKTFSANFNSHKHKSRRDKSVHIEEQKHPEHRISEENSDHLKSKISRKHLIKEYDRIANENQKLVEYISSLQAALSKKDSQVLKLKEKLSSIQNFNKEILNENNIIKTQYQDVLVNLEECKTQLKAKVKCASCEELKVMLRNQNNEVEIANTTNKELHQDLDMLKNVIFRLNVQLERYQEKLHRSKLTSSNHTLSSSPLVDADVHVTEPPSNGVVLQDLHSDAAVDHSDHLHTPISWGKVNTHTLGPLLDAYQDTIKEKEDIIKSYEIELVSFTGKLKAIVDENEKLHRKSVEDAEMVQKNLMELESNRKELKITKDQNDLLIKKCALKHDKLQEICKVYDHKIDCMRRDYEVLQEQYHKTRVEFSSIQGKYQSLVDAHDSLKSDKQNVIPLAVHTTSVNECKRLFEELKVQYDSEKSKLLNQIKLLEQQIVELEKKVIDTGAEKRDLQIKVKSTEKQLKKIEHRLVESHNALTHTQISRDACKRQLSKAIEFGRELVSEQESLLQQLSTRHKENKAVKQIGSNIVSRMDILKSQLKTVQKDAFQQLASVEQRIQEQDSSMESMRREHEDEIDKLLQQIQEKDDCINRLVDQNNAIPAAPYLLYREKHVHLS